VERLDAQLLLAHLTGRPRAWLLAHDEAELDAAQAAAWQAGLARRAAGEPLAYIVGQVEFCGLALAVSPAVLVPRPETEDLVRWARECLASAPSREVVDLGTGSGAIAIALALTPGVARPQVTATDASASALAVAQRNDQRHGAGLQLLQGDWWAPLAGRRFGLALANPPYVVEGDPHLAALAHEPVSALTAGRDGLDDLRQLVAGAPAHLLPGGWLLLEHGHDQSAAVAALLGAAGFVDVTTRTDLAGLPRCTGGRLPAPAADASI
jgi:release factor glutamine methyltransferase